MTALVVDAPCRRNPEAYHRPKLARPGTRRSAANIVCSESMHGAFGPACMLAHWAPGAANNLHGTDEPLYKLPPQRKKMIRSHNNRASALSPKTMAKQGQPGQQPHKSCRHSIAKTPEWEATPQNRGCGSDPPQAYIRVSEGACFDAIRERSGILECPCLGRK